MTLLALKGQWSLQLTCCTQERKASISVAERGKNGINAEHIKLLAKIT